MKILDGRDYFSQWDLNVKVTSNKFKVGDEIHFYNVRQPNALPVKAYLLDGKVVAEVPNILLQSAYPIFAYRVVDEAGATYTIKKYEFKVKQRPKPDDYVYTQTEVKTYDTLVERIEEMEKNGVSDERIGQAVSDYLNENPVNVDLTGYATEKWVEDNYQPKGNYLTEHQDISGKLDASELPTAVNTALAQAKASGEFDGKDGKDGVDGQDGYTPQKGIDYFDGKDGKDGVDGQPGKDGEDGYTPVKGVDYFDGQPGKDGEPGKDGAPGYTPVRGTDYYTEADKTEMVNAVLSALPTWTGGSY